ncbi:unnamed protein product [Diatraea saccharalis]|uniref:Uncharacterized protein n=1 Tax=Diatraea saccharalis TaxID=40085 RepID=A0A9N9RBY5_9NEOP|nr:unnamed protein product [Diatraea saccharalis]
MPMKRTPTKKNSSKCSSGTMQHSESAPNIAAKCELSAIENINQRKRKRGEDELQSFRNEFMEMFSSWKREQEVNYTNILSAIEEIKVQNSEIHKSIAFMSEKYDVLVEKIRTLENEKNSNHQQIAILESKMETLERSIRSANIELCNIPKLPNENHEKLLSIAQETARVVGVPIDKSNIRNIYRINSKNENNKPIIVELSSALLKEKILKAVKI